MPLKRCKIPGGHFKQDLKLSPQIDKITKKTNGTLECLRRNLKTCHTQLKETSYTVLIRACCNIVRKYGTHTLKMDVKKLESVQWRAARFVTENNRRDSSVTSMMQTLGWQSLEDRRREAMMYKVLVHVLVPVPHENHTEKHQVRSRGNNSLNGSKGGMWNASP